MYLASTRSFVIRKTRQLNYWKQYANYGSSGTQTRCIKHILGKPNNVRYYKHQARTQKVTATGFGYIRASGDPFLPNAGTPIVEAAINFQPSPYTISTTCLGPFIDGRHWFAEYADPEAKFKQVLKPFQTNKDGLEMSGEKSEQFFGENKDKLDTNVKETQKSSELNKDQIEINVINSLESLRKRIKGENLKDPEIPPGWEKQK